MAYNNEWAKREIELYCKDLSSNEDGQYLKDCCDSAIKAYMHLEEDNHSGLSINLTKHILNRLIEHKPLTPLKGIDDEWNLCTYKSSVDSTEYQNNRYTALFKVVDKDGTIRYNDVNRVVFYDEMCKANPWSGKIYNDVVNNVFPITFPYSPPKTPYEVHGKTFTIKKEDGKYKATLIPGEFNATDILYFLTPDGERVDINKRYIQDELTGVMVELEKDDERLNVEAPSVN